MDLENYTNVNIFKRVYEKKEVTNKENMIEQPHNHIAASGPRQHSFNPYTNNMGTTIGKYFLSIFFWSTLLTKFY